MSKDKIVKCININLLKYKLNKTHEGISEAYTGKYYKTGGRYFCTPCGVPVGERVVTEFDLDQAFRMQFGQTVVPPISRFGFQMNTKGTSGGAKAFLEKVEFFSE